MERMLGWARSAIESQSFEIQAATDQRASPTYARDLAWAIMELVRKDASGVIHVTNLGGASRADFAAQLYKATAQRVRVRGVLASSFPVLAPRPRNTELSLDSLSSLGLSLRPWEEALLEAVAEASR